MLRSIYGSVTIDSGVSKDLKNIESTVHMDGLRDSRRRQSRSKINCPLRTGCRVRRADSSAEEESIVNISE